MLGHTFYHGILKRTSVAFGSLFTDISVLRQNSAGAEVKRLNVPIEYGPKEHWYRRTTQDPNIDRQTAIQLPRMSYDLTSITYDPERKVNSLQQNVFQKDATTRYRQFSPVPYNLEYKLYIGVKEATDGDQIIEQILPYFGPGLSMNMNLVPSLNHKVDVPIIFTAGPERFDNWNSGFDDDRIIEYTLTFMVKTYLFGHVLTQSIIRKIQVDFYAVSGALPITDEVAGSTPRSERITITPNPSNANPGDNYTYTIEIEHFDDNKRYSPVTGTDEDIS